MKPTKVFQKFYSSVILNSTETVGAVIMNCPAFYSSVILNSTETARVCDRQNGRFYSSVMLYLNC